MSRMTRRSKYHLHPLPFIVAAGVSGAALEPGDVGFPFALPREGGEAGHVALEVKVIDEGQGLAVAFQRRKWCFMAPR